MTSAGEKIVLRLQSCNVADSGINVAICGARRPEIVSQLYTSL